MFRASRRWLAAIGPLSYALAASAQIPNATESQRRGEHKFSIAVNTDTQYLFDQDRYDPPVLKKTFQWIVDHTREENIVFGVQLGDIVNNGLASEFAMASDAFKVLDNNAIQ